MNRSLSDISLQTGLPVLRLLGFSRSAAEVSLEVTNRTVGQYSNMCKVNKSPSIRKIAPDEEEPSRMTAMTRLKNEGTS